MRFFARAVLLIACVNVGEFAAGDRSGRPQQGSSSWHLAPRGRLIREFSRESAMLCVASGALGYPIVALTIRRPSLAQLLSGVRRNILVIRSCRVHAGSGGNGAV